MIQNTLLNEKPSEQVKTYVEQYKSLFDIDTDRAYAYIKNNERFEELTVEWYDKLAQGDMDAAYRVYDDEYYFTDIWNCFVTYSRRYLRDIARPCFTDGTSFIDRTQDAKIIVDVGCGIGYTTSALTQLYPNAKVYGTNLKNTKQWKFCELMAQKYNFNMIESVDEVDGKADVVFASEYFEHFYKPVEHVAEIISKISPNYFVIGNAFNTRSIGHFITYMNMNVKIDQSKIGKFFNDSLRRFGYTKLESTLFNNKPNIWQKNKNVMIGDA